MNKLNRMRGIAQDLGVNIVGWGTGAVLASTFVAHSKLAFSGFSAILIGIFLIAVSLTGPIEK
jgi:hypothetical protein